MYYLYNIVFNRKMKPTDKIILIENQGGITCGAIEDPRKSSKAIDERGILNFRDKNGVIARFLYYR